MIELLILMLLVLALRLTDMGPEDEGQVRKGWRRR